MKDAKISNKEIACKYKDGAKYRATIICSYYCRETLLHLKKTLENGTPYILLDNIIISQSSNQESELLLDTGEFYFEDDDDSIMDPDYIPNDEDHCMTDIGDVVEDENSSIMDPDYIPNVEDHRMTDIGDIVEDNDSGIMDPGYIPNNGDYSITDIGIVDKDLLNIEESELNNNKHAVDVYKSLNKGPPDFIAEPLNTNVQISDNKKKKYFCIYCKKKCSHFSRHLETVHKNETEVKLFTSLPKGCEERKKIIELIRKRGNFLYNCDVSYNGGDLITTRRPMAEKYSNTDKYMPCPCCYGFYSKTSLRKHFKKCSAEAAKGDRNILVMGKRVRCNLSINANDTVKNHIFPILRDDEISKPLRYDELVITYANKMTTKYRKQHNYPMIRARMRLIGRILFEIKKLNPSITDFANIFHPKNYDNVILAIHSVAALDNVSKKYKAPSTAATCGCLLKKCGNIYIAELIKLQNKERKIEVEDFLKLIDVDYGVAVNKTVSENQLEQKRKKIINLPSIEDIKTLNKYLKINREKYYTQVLSNFTVDNYKKLAAYTLTSVQVFNRRRAGEIERIEIRDFENNQSVDTKTNHDIMHSLSVQEQEAAKNYIRFTIRGKLGREVPVLLNKDLAKCIELLIKCRQHVGVAESNPFIFGIPGKSNEHKYLKACNLLKEFSEKCGAKNPLSLRGTNLRKQIATQSAIYNLSETEVSDLANFMGHHEKIHKEHYRVPIVAREITRMSRLLEMAQGGMACEETEKSEDGSEAENDHNFNIQHECNSYSTEVDRAAQNTCNNIDIIKEVTQKRSTSPMGKVKRRSWNDLEMSTATKIFSEYIKSGLLPSLAQCQDAVREETTLQNRSPAQLKLWIHNQIKKKKLSFVENDGLEKVRIKRVTWTSPEKSLAFRLFNENIANKKLPSLTECRHALLDHNLVFKNRTAIQLKLWVNNQIRKIKDC